MSLTLKPLVPRRPDEPHRAATQLELFFDLVSVIAIAAVTASVHHAISDGHGLAMLPNFVFLFIAIWWAWMNYTWFASAYDNDDALQRVLTVFIMAGFLTFAAGAGHIFETLDFGIGLVGWIIMRTGMVLLWLRAAAAGPTHRRTALRYAGGIVFAQSLWAILYFGFEAGTPLFIAVGCGIFLVEFLVPVFAEKAGRTPWHRHHIIERYGLLNIIVLGEALLSASLALSQLYEGRFSLDLIVVANSGLLLVFICWWLYFIEAEHLDSTDLKRAFVWGYGHVFVFAAGTMLGAGLSATLDTVTHHSRAGPGEAAAWVDGAMAVYLVALWFVRDRVAPIGWRRYVLLVAGLVFVGLAFAGATAWIAAVFAVLTLVARFPLGEKAG